LAGYSACACGGGGVENICEGEFGGRGGGGGVVGVGCEGSEISARHLNGILQDNGTSSSRENDQSIKHHPATSAYTTLVLNVPYTQTYIIPLHPTTEDLLLFMTNFNQAKRLQLTPLLSNSAHLGGWIRLDAWR